MPGVTKVISTSFDTAKRLVVKFLFRGALIDGKGDVRTAIEASPYGVDSNPVKDKVALLGKTETYGKYYILGYLNTLRKALTGEIRIFSTNSEGTLQTYIWLKNDGKMLVGGDKYGGIPKVKDPTDPTAGLLKKINNLEQDLNTLKTKLAISLVPVTEPGGGAPSAFQAVMITNLTAYVGATLTPTTEASISNDKALHGNN